MPEDTIHAYFGLSYANYLVMPRALLQSMPAPWQQRFVALLNQFNRHFEAVELPDFEVLTGRWREVGDLTDDELARLHITRGDEDDDETGSEPTYYDGRGKEMSYADEVFDTTFGPRVPHYNRGRTYVSSDGSTAP